MRRLRKKALIQTNDMEQTRRDTINEWSNAEDTLGTIPYLYNQDNPAGSTKSNVQFQQDLATMIRADSEYYARPTLERLCVMIAGIMHTWERLIFFFNPW